MQPAAVLSVLVQAKGIVPTNRNLMLTERQLRKVATAGNAMGGQIAKGTKTAAVGAAVGLGYVVKKAADFEAQMSSLKAVTGANRREMGLLRVQAMKAGAATKYSALEAAAAQTELAKGGLSTAQIMRGGLRSALALAAAGEMDLAEAAATTANALNLFELKGRDSMKVADMLAAAANTTTADVTDFAMALKQGGSVAKTVGLSFGQTVLILEALAKSGVRNADAGTSMKTALIQLVNPTDKQAELAAKLGLNFLDSAGNMKSAADISTMLRGKLGDMTAAQRTATLATLAGTDGVRTLTALYDAGPAKLDRWERGLNKTGTAATVAATKQDNLKGKLENLQGSIETIAIAIGTKAIPELTRLAEKITAVLNNPKLTTEEKIGRLSTVIGDAIGKGFDKGVDVAAAAGPKVAAALAKGLVSWWAEASPLEKLLGTAAIIRILGGRGAITATGAAIGRLLGIGITAGAAGGAAGGGAAAGAAGGGVLGGLAGKLRAGAGRAGWIGLGLFLGDQLMREIGRAVATKSPDLEKALKARADRGFGGSLALWRGIQDLGGKGDEIGASERLLAAVKAVRDENGRITAEKARQLRQDAQSLSLTRQQRGALNEVLNVGVRRAQNIGLVRNEFSRMKKGSVLDVQELRQVTESNFARIASSMGLHTREGRRALQTNFRLGLQTIARFKQEGTLTTGQAMREVRRLLSVHSGAGKEALKRNYLGARNFIARTMRDSKGITAEGMREIRRIFAAELRLYGLSKEAVKFRLQGKEQSGKTIGAPLVGKQRGGAIVTSGPAYGDAIPALLERGEVVVNKKAVQAYGGTSAVNAMNHAVPRFQGGGIVELLHPFNDPAGHGGSNSHLHLAMRNVEALVALGRRLQAQGWLVGEHPAFGGIQGRHAPGGYHYSNQAIDVNWPDAGQEGAKIKALLRTLGDVAAGKGGAATSAGLAKLAKVKLSGPDSPLTSVMQAGLSTVHDAAQSKLDDLTSSSGAAFEGRERFPGGSGEDLMRKISVQRGWSFRDWWELDRRETGHGSNLANPTSTARLRGQFLSMNWGKYGPGSDPRQNPSMREQIISMARYIAERYGNPSAALAHHNANNWYQLGGVAGFQKGGARGDSRSLNKAINTIGGRNRKGKPFTPKQRSKALRGFLKRVKGIGLGTGLEKALEKHTDDAAKYEDFAQRAQQLTVDTGDGNPILGTAFGRTEAQWLTDRVSALFSLRNALIRAHKIILDRRERISAMVEQARKRHAQVSEQIRQAARVKGGLERQLAKAEKHPKRNKRQIRELRKQIQAIDRAQKPRVRTRDAIKNRILPALTGKQEQLNTRRGDLLSSLDQVQGVGSSTAVMGKLPPVGTLGGDIFAAQIRLQELGQKPAVTDTSTDTDAGDRNSDLLREALRLANLRAAVSEAQFRIFQDLPRGTQFMGAFEKGGVALVGERGPELAHMPSGTRVHNAADTAAMLAPEVHVIVNGDIVGTPPGQDPVEVMIGDRRFAAAVERVNRGTARRAGRGLAGGGW